MNRETNNNSVLLIKGGQMEAGFRPYEGKVIFPDPTLNRCYIPTTIQPKLHVAGLDCTLRTTPCNQTVIECKSTDNIGEVLPGNDQCSSIYISLKSNTLTDCNEGKSTLFTGYVFGDQNFKQNMDEETTLEPNELGQDH